MKLPLKPPSYAELITEVEPKRFLELLQVSKGPEIRGHYYHWDQLRHRPPPEGTTLKEWWLLVKIARQSLAQKLPLTDVQGNPFSFAMTGNLLKKLHRMDKDVAGMIQAEAPIANDTNRDRYIINSLFEEAITSSQLEGASTTTKEAKKMLRSGRKPRNRSEQMIINNFHAMRFIREHCDDPLTIEFIWELQTILTDKTLDDESGSGRWRKNSEEIIVQDNRDGTVLYTAPDADLIPERIEALINFANATEHKNFIHPVISGVILHFMLSYEHPFVDGNGRTARALFYWYMAREKYWLIEFLSISKEIKKAPFKYARSYLYVENDDNDLSYFLDYQLDVILNSIESLFTYLSRKTREYKKTQSIMQGELQRILNHRQIAVLSHALKNPGHEYSIKSHRRSQSISYQTARTDLLTLSDLGLLTQYQRGNAFLFESPRDLHEKIEDFHHVQKMA